jgi:hypothetical protein
LRNPGAMGNYCCDLPGVPVRLLLATVALCCVCRAGSLSAQEPLHAPDGGTREQMQSVYIPPVPNAPFTATVQTEWTHILPDGSKSTVFNHRLVARDSSGRVFQERRFFDPQGDTHQTRLSLLQYDDPNRHERLLCRPVERICELSRLTGIADFATQQPGRLPDGSGTLSREDLGHRSIEGLDVIGTREVTTLNAGTFGNERSQPVVKEFWYSPRFSVNLFTQRFDPRVSSMQIIGLSNIVPTEPDPSLFQPPSGYRTLNLAGR